MRIHQIDPADRGLRKTFLELPFQLYRGLPQWVPPLRIEARRMLDARRHPFYQHSQAAFFLVRNERGDAVGRLSVLDNQRYNEYNRTRCAFFYLFECVDDPEASQLLFSAAFSWARRRGLSTMLGPKGFTALDGMGLLVDGFDHRPAFGVPYNMPYYERLVLDSGFEVETDVVSGYLGADVAFPGRIHEVAQRVCDRRGLHIARYRSRRDLLKPDAKTPITLQRRPGRDFRQRATNR